MMFSVGMKVVCIKPIQDWTKDDAALQAIPSRPVLNGIYTIRAIVLAYGRPFIYLTEIYNPPHNWTEIGFAEAPFWSGMFRPVVERKTDISIFHSILRSASHKELT